MSDPVYRASPGFHISHKDAAILGPAWEKLERRLKRPPTPSDLVEEARKESSPFHVYFEWTVERQVQIYLETRARYLISALDVVLADHGDQPVRAIIPMLDGSGAFMSTAKAARERPDVIERQVMRAKADARSFYERYEQWVGFREFSPVMDTMEAAKRLAYEG
jgi:hypothetical protein